MYNVLYTYTGKLWKFHGMSPASALMTAEFLMVLAVHQPFTRPERAN